MESSSIRRFKSEFQVIWVSQKDSNIKLYQCVGIIDNHDYLCYKFKSNNDSLKYHIQIAKSLSKIYHKNVLRYYNSWIEKPKNQNKNFQSNLFLQTEKSTKLNRSIFDQMNLIQKFNIIQQILDGICEFTKGGLRQNLSLDNIFISDDNCIKIGNLEDVEIIHENYTNAIKIFNDVQILVCQLFKENKQNLEIFFNEKIKNVTDFRNLFLIFSEIRQFIKVMTSPNQEIVLTRLNCKRENSIEWLEKLFTVVNKELRLYKEKTDKKAEQIFDLKNADIVIEEKDDPYISIKNPYLIGCLIKGSNQIETSRFFERLISIRSS